MTCPVDTGLNVCCWHRLRFLTARSVFKLTTQARKQNSCCQIMWCHRLVLVDAPLSAFLLLLRLPSCTGLQLSPHKMERTPSTLGWCNGISVREAGSVAARQSVTPPCCGWWGLKERWGLVGGRSNVWIIFILLNGEHLCAVGKPVEEINLLRCWLVMFVEVSSNHLMLYRFSLILIVSFKSINIGCTSASRGLWQSDSLSSRVWKHVTVSF